MTPSTFIESLGESASPELLALVGQALLDVEAKLASTVKSNVPMVQGAGQATLHAGGKRLRPVLTILAAEAVGAPYSSERAVTVAASVEMVHMATLIHDDVIDEAATRRGEPTAAATFGNTGSILSGDVLLAKAMSLLAQDGDLPIIRTVAESVVDMAEGEAKEVESRHRFDLSMDEHFEILRMKTATFIECCCRAGALLAGASPEICSALGEYGHHLGMAFQIQDDVLDYQGQKAKTGKPIATDFREGCATLPLIFLAARLSETERSFIQARFGTSVSAEDIDLIIGWMKERGTIGQADREARERIDMAKAALSALPNTGARDILLHLADFVIEREA